MNIVIYTKPDCVQCHATCRALDRKGISYQRIDVQADQHALDHVRSLGYQQVPVVETPDGHWSGFRPEKISSLSATLTA